MYQWEERKQTKTEKKVGGGEVTKTTYSYHKVWSPRRIDSGEFKRSGGHQNPGSLPYPSRDFIARQAKVGAFGLTPDQVKEIDAFEPLSLGPDYRPPAGLADGPRPTRAASTSAGPRRSPDRRRAGELPGGQAPGGKPHRPAAGKRPGAYQTEAGDKLMMVEPGEHPASAMFKQARAPTAPLPGYCAWWASCSWASGSP